jgi:predicted amidohydrolase YtcJ
VRLAFASDWPVADVNPLRGIQAALERPVFEGAGDERLDLHAVLAAYTTGGACRAYRGPQGHAESPAIWPMSSC